MGYSDENVTTTPEPLPVGCIFDGALGWHNGYRIVDLAIAYGMDRDPDLGWDENDAKIMAAYEASEDSVVLAGFEGVCQFCGRNVIPGPDSTWVDERDSRICFTGVVDNAIQHKPRPAEGETLDQARIADVVDHWREQAEDYLDQFCPPFHHLEWDDGLYVRADEIEEADAHSSVVWHVNDIIVPMFAADEDFDNPLHLGYVYTALAERFAALAKGTRRD